MKKLSLLLLIIPMLSLSQDRALQGIIIGTATINQMAHINDFDHLFNGKWENEDTRVLFNSTLIAVAMLKDQGIPLEITATFDPAMAFKGSEHNPKSLDAYYSVHVPINKYSAGISFEQFQNIGYHSLGFQFQRNVADTNINIVASPGLGVKLLYNQGRITHAPEAYLTFKSPSIKGFRVIFTANATYRPELDNPRIIYSNYIGISKRL